VVVFWEISNSFFHRPTSILDLASSSNRDFFSPWQASNCAACP
jgi:hypothetical protein